MASDATAMMRAFANPAGRNRFPSLLVINPSHPLSISQKEMEVNKIHNLPFVYVIY
jgi:hypothetical protein